MRCTLFILLSAVCVFPAACVCTKEDVSEAIGVDLENIDLFCDPDGWFHDRINKHIRLENFCGCSGTYDHDVYCDIEGVVETDLDCSGVSLPEPTARLIEIRELKAAQEEEKSKLLAKEEEKKMAKVMAQKEQAQKHTEEQGRKEEAYKKHLEEQEKRHTRYEEEEKTFIEESKQNDNLVQDFLDEDLHRAHKE